MYHKYVIRDGCFLFFEDIIVSPSLELMAKYLVHQQFYSEEDDTIVSRDKQVRVNIPGARELVNSFVGEFLDGIDLIAKGRYHQYLVKRGKKLPINVDTIEQEFSITISQLDESTKSDLIIANFLIGSIRTYLQKKEFLSCINDVKYMLEIKLGSELNRIIQERLEYLYSTNDPTVSLLHNLALLRLLSSLYGSTDTFNQIDKLVETHCITLIQKLMP